MGVPAPLPNEGPTGLQYSRGIKGIVWLCPRDEPLHGGNIKDVIIGEMAAKEQGLQTCSGPKLA
jgi:hypothetical protein